MVMATTIQDKMKAVGAKRRKKIEARAAELIAEEMALRELRRAHHLTQSKVAEELGVSQDGVSRLEQRSDLLISTLRKYVEAVGGELQLVVVFPDRPAVRLTGLADMGDDVPTPKRRSTKRARNDDQRHTA
jgi:DNA-binding XRE family transcriptional regulator